MKKLTNQQLNRLTVEEFKKVEKIPVVIVLDNLRSLNNIGSVFRTADAFRVSHIYLCGITACPPHREIHKTALGATESVSWSYFKSTKEAILTLKKEGYNILSVEQADKSTSLNDLSPAKHKKMALVFGNEVQGVNQEIIDLSDIVIEIPQAGTKHSLNVSVSVGVVLWEIVSKTGLIKDN